MLAICPSFGAQTTNSRLAQIDEQIVATGAILKDATNETERAQWQQHLEMLRQDRASLAQRVDLDEKERRLVSSQKRQSLFILQEALRSIDTDVTGAEKELAKMGGPTHELRSARVQLEQSHVKLMTDPEGNSEKLAELDQRLRLQDEEILAAALERDKAALRLQMINEASRIEVFLRSEPTSSRVTLGLFRERGRQVGAARKLKSDMEASLELCQQRRGDIAAALELSTEKVAHMESEMALLDKKRHGVRDWITMRPLFYAANMEKKYLSRRVECQQRQLAAINDTLTVGAQFIDLCEKNVGFLSDDRASLAKRFWRRFAIPVGAIIAILLGHLLFSRVCLRLVFSKEHWIVGRRLSGYLAVVLILLTLVLFFLEDLKSIATVIGIASAAIVIALQDVFSALAGWFVIVVSRKFAIGHRVEIDGHCGDVIDIQILRTTLLEVNNWLGVDEPTGRIIVVPNNFVFKGKFFNYTHLHPYIWHKLDVTVTYETPYREAEALFRRILEEETRSEFEEAGKAAASMEHLYGVKDVAAQPKLYMILVDSGVLFRLLYVTHYRRVGSTRNRLNARIMLELEKDPRMQLAYPTHREIVAPESGVGHSATGATLPKDV
jgi:small-conductance mechanosensitive channel